MLQLIDCLVAGTNITRRPLFKPQALGQGAYGPRVVSLCVVLVLTNKEEEEQKKEEEWEKGEDEEEEEEEEEDPGPEEEEDREIVGPTKVMTSGPAGLLVSWPALQIICCASLFCFRMDSALNSFALFIEVLVCLLIFLM